jgi:hypothetical protein
MNINWEQTKAEMETKFGSLASKPDSYPEEMKAQ